ncbi:hypothetical protein [[Pseudomonas] boreopolis]|uniref:Uncharacterized protein n=1 Tax=Xanthomonas boreopolis TaxID=86183 RepID=A0A919F7A4_9XANT|nr:hypothetical protein GCM10009090_16310 [[Pseudomonas] boreopolis]
MDTTGGTALAAVMVLVKALHDDGVLPMERFIETLRRHALLTKARGAEAMGEDLLEMAAQLARSLQRQRQ